MKEEPKEITSEDIEQHGNTKQGKKVVNECPIHTDDGIAAKFVRKSQGSSKRDSNHREEKRKITIRMQSLEEDNERLRERVAHAENLGVLVADAEQQKIDLIEENLALRKRLEILEKSFGKRTKQDSSTDHCAAVTGAECNVFCIHPAHSAQLNHVQSDSPPAAIDADQVDKEFEKRKEDHPHEDDVMRVASLFLSQAAAASFAKPAQHSKENLPENNAAAPAEAQKEEKALPAENIQTLETTDCNKTENHAGPENEKSKFELVTVNLPTTPSEQGPSSDRVKDPATSDPDASDEADEEKFNQQIEQIEEMIGFQRENTDMFEVPSVNETSMTSQFTKIAGVFASLAQRVVQSQRHAKNSQCKEWLMLSLTGDCMQAYCDALVSENKKLKSQLQICEQKLHHLKKAQASSTTTISNATQTAREPQSPDDGSLVSKLQARVKKLEKQRAEILQVNKSWDTQYRRLKEELDKKSSPLNGAAKLNDLPGTSKEHFRHRDPEAGISDPHKKTTSASRHQPTKQIQALKHEVTRLKERAAKLESEKGCLKAENARLNQALEATYSVYERRSLPRQERNDLPAFTADPSEHPKPEAMEELRTHIEVLQEQVKIYREDFETERKDRERNQSEKQRLQEALVRSRREVHALSQQVRTHEAEFQLERREKEKAQRQVRLCQRNQAGPRRRDRYYNDAAEPIAFQGHRRSDGTNPNYAVPATSSRRRSRGNHHLYETTSPLVWESGDSSSHEDLPRSPDDDLDSMF